MEPHFGQDLSHVTIHNNARSHRAALALETSAFARGTHIFMGRGAYEPNYDSGRKLLAHEIQHTIQDCHPTKIWKSPPQDDVVSHRASYAQLKKALGKLRLKDRGATGSKTINVGPPEEHELVGLADAEYTALVEDVQIMMKEVGEGTSNADQYDRKQLRMWWEALNSHKTSSRMLRDDVSRARSRVKPYGDFVMKSGLSPRVKAWFSNMFPQAVIDLDMILRTGKPTSYSGEDKKKWGYIVDLKGVMSEPDKFDDHVVIVPRRIAWGFIRDRTEKQFLSRIMEIDKDADEGLKVGVKAYPDDTYAVSLKRDWAKPGSFYDAWGLEVDASPISGDGKVSQRKALSKRQTKAIEAFGEGVSFDEAGTIDYSAVAYELRPRFASPPSAAGGAYNKCLTVWTDRLKNYSSTIVLGFPEKDTPPIIGKFKVFSASNVSVKFQYVYEKDGDSRIGQFEGELSNLPLSPDNRDNPSMLPGLKLSGDWWEKMRGTSKWSFTGTGYFEMSEEFLTKGFTTMGGKWFQEKAGMRGGVWAIDFPDRLPVSDANADMDPERVGGVEQLKNACFAGR